MSPTLDTPKTLVEEIRRGNPSPVYLFHGSEEFLVHQAARQMVDALAGKGEAAAELVRLEEEPIDWPAVVLRLRTGSLFSGRVVYIATHVGIFSSRKGPTSRLKAILARWSNEARENRESIAADFLKFLGRLRLGIDEIFPEDGGTSGDRRLEEETGEELKGRDREILEAIGTHCRELGLRPPKRQAEMAELREALEEGFGTGNVLILTAAEVDRRKALFKVVRKVGKVLDFSPDRRRLQSAALRVVQDCFRLNKKRAAAEVVSRLVLRVGLDLRRLASEAEKLVFHAGDRTEITLEDCDSLIRRSREEQIFDLTDALGSGDTARAILSLRRLLQQGEYFLRILGTLRKQFERILVARDLLDGDLGDIWDDSMQYNRFEARFYPALQQTKESGEIQLENVHPYALFKTLQQANRFQSAHVQRFLRGLLRVNRSAFTGSVDPALLIESLIHRMGRDPGDPAGDPQPPVL